MNKRNMGRGLAVFGVALVLSQVPADRPWQALVAVGFLLALVGGLLYVDNQPAGTEQE